MSHSHNDSSSTSRPAYVQKFLEELKKQQQQDIQITQETSIEGVLSRLLNDTNSDNVIDVQIMEEYADNLIKYGYGKAFGHLLNPIIAAVIDVENKKLRDEFLSIVPICKKIQEFHSNEKIAKIFISTLCVYLTMGLTAANSNRNIQDELDIIVRCSMATFQIFRGANSEIYKVEYFDETKYLICSQMSDDSSKIIEDYANTIIMDQINTPIQLNQFLEYAFDLLDNIHLENLEARDKIFPIYKGYLRFLIVNKLEDPDAKKAVAKLKEKYEKLAIPENEKRYLNYTTKSNENSEKALNQKQNSRISLIILLVLLMVLVASSVLTFGASTIPLVAVILSSYSGAGIIAGIAFYATCASSAITAGFAGFFGYKAKKYQEKSNHYQQELTTLLSNCENSATPANSTNDSIAEIIASNPPVEAPVTDDKTIRAAHEHVSTNFHQMKQQLRDNSLAAVITTEPDDSEGEGETTESHPHP